MKFKYLGCLMIMILGTLFVAAQEQFDIDSLIEDVSIDRQQDAFSNYSYKMEFIRYKKTFYGKDKLVKRFDVVLPSTMPKNRRYQHRLLLVYDSSQNLTQLDIVNSRKQIIKDLEDVENEQQNINDQNNTKPNTGGYLTLRATTNISNRFTLGVNILELLKGADFKNYKELKVNGRDTISLDFQPPADKVYNGDLFYLGRIEGVVLIDKIDKRVVEVEAFPLGKLEEYRNQTPEQREEFRAFHYLQTRVPEGFWFPKSVSLNFMKSPKDFDNVEVKVQFTFSDYKQFVVSVDNYRVQSSNETENKPENEPEN